MKTALLIVALVASACGKGKEAASGSAGSSGSTGSATTASNAAPVGGPCKDLSAERCLDAVYGMYKADKDAANVLANHLCDGELGTVTRQACTLSGHVYREGAPQTPKDPAKALARYERGCPLDAKDAEAGSCFRVGLAHAKGTLTLGQPATLPIDVANGKPYLELACTKGFKEACQVAQSL